jgi:hypothetical protein
VDERDTEVGGTLLETDRGKRDGGGRNCRGRLLLAPAGRDEGRAREHADEERPPRRVFRQRSSLPFIRPFEPRIAHGRLACASPESWTTIAAGVPESQDFYGVVTAEPIVQVITNSIEVNAAHAFQSSVQRG